MAQFQVVAVYPSGTRFEVLKPHDSFYWASLHRRRCEETADARDTWVYEIDMTYTGSDGQTHWRGNVTPEDLGYDPVELIGALPSSDVATWKDNQINYWRKSAAATPHV